ncbi:MAG: hypothetical protein KIT17_14955 [Rubrivivax sp.]|nr:hypothetical protein [Rubrivivax sp.]
MPDTANAADREALLLRTAEEVLLPLARLCVAQGLHFAKAGELFKRAYVRAARERRSATGERSARDVSQVATATGLSRRDVARIGDAPAPRALQRTTPATQLLTRWLADRSLRHRNGRMRKLPRQGPPPSFEAMAQAVTRHVHPRSLLDEMLRLGYVKLVDDGASVVPLPVRVVPEADEARMFGFLAANVGDHLSAAVANVLHRDRRHLEQAIFSNTLSGTAVSAAKALVAAQWTHLLGALVPALEGLIEEDHAAGRTADHRLRVGLYAYHEPLPAPPAAAMEPSDGNDART